MTVTGKVVIFFVQFTGTFLADLQSHSVCFLASQSFKDKQTQWFGTSSLIAPGLNSLLFALLNPFNYIALLAYIAVVYSEDNIFISYPKFLAV